MVMNEILECLRIVERPFDWAKAGHGRHNLFLVGLLVDGQPSKERGFFPWVINLIITSTGKESEYMYHQCYFAADVGWNQITRLVTICCFSATSLDPASVSV